MPDNRTTAEPIKAWADKTETKVIAMVVGGASALSAIGAWRIIANMDRATIQLLFILSMFATPWAMYIVYRFGIYQVSVWIQGAAFGTNSTMYQADRVAEVKQRMIFSIRNQPMMDGMMLGAGNQLPDPPRLEFGGEEIEGEVVEV